MKQSKMFSGMTVRELSSGSDGKIKWISLRRVFKWYILTTDEVIRWLESKNIFGVTPLSRTSSVRIQNIGAFLISSQTD